MSSECPKCHKKIKATYFKQNCPYCDVNLLYYKLDEQLEADAKKAQAEVDAVNRVKELIKNSSVKSPLHIIRLILFFTPLASMCLPMFWAGHKDVSLIGFIMSIVNHGFDFGAMLSDKGYFFAVLSMVMIILLSLAVIISSLFSAGKRGFRRNIIFSAVNTYVLLALSALAISSGASAKVGLTVTLAIYVLELLLHYILADVKNKKRLVFTSAFMITAVVCAIVFPLSDTSSHELYNEKTADNNGISVVSFNLAAPWGTPFDSTSEEKRIPRYVEYMENIKPDLIGTQELNSKWYSSVCKDMSEYDSYAVKRGGDDNENRSEMNGVFWKKNKFTLVESNTFWLSQTPDKESRFTYTDENGEKQEAGCNRICSYAVLNDKDNNKVLFMNTHLDNTGEQACNFGAELIVSRMNELKKKYENITVIVTGDFNSDKNSLAYKTMTSALKDTTDYTKEQGTWQDWGYTDTGDTPIDFIFTSGSSSNYTVLSRNSDGYISDHYGILVNIN